MYSDDDVEEENPPFEEEITTHTPYEEENDIGFTVEEELDRPTYPTQPYQESD